MARRFLVVSARRVGVCRLTKVTSYLRSTKSGGVHRAHASNLKISFFPYAIQSEIEKCRSRRRAHRLRSRLFTSTVIGGERNAFWKCVRHTRACLERTNNRRGNLFGFWFLGFLDALDCKHFLPISPPPCSPRSQGAFVRTASLLHPSATGATRRARR